MHGPTEDSQMHQEKGRAQSGCAAMREGGRKERRTGGVLCLQYKGGGRTGGKTNAAFSVWRECTGDILVLSWKILGAMLCYDTS